MKSNFFLQELDFDFEYQSIPNEIQELTGKIGVDAVHCSGRFPAIFIKEVSSFNENTLYKIAEIQRKIWNESSVIFLYVTSPTEIRIYNCNATPVFRNRKIKIEEELHHLEIVECKISDKQKLNVLKQVFSAVAIDSGLIWTHIYSKEIKLQTKVDHYLVESLLGLANKLKNDIKDEQIIHSLLMRSIFIMYLQDRKAIPEEIWNKIGHYDFLKILDNLDQTYQLFAEIETHFNGNVFPIRSNEKEIVTEDHLNLLKRCLTDGNIDLSQETLFPDWRLFKFNFIRIELLSEIYENFLTEFSPIRKKKTGAYYTPPSLVELVLNEVLQKKGSDYNQKILDPACGSGIFLAQAYKRIVKYWINKHSKEDLNFSILSEIMKNNIFGVELDKKSIRVAAFSLYLALIDFLEPKDVWLKNGDEFPYLIYDAESEDENDKKGNNLFRTDTIVQSGKFEKVEYDIIIGNPPFGTKNLSDNVRKYCDNYNFSKQFAIPFIHKSSKLAPKGKIALLFNTKLLTNNQTPAQNFRRWLFNDCYVEKVYNLSILRKAPKHFGGQLFSSAVAPVSIVCFQNEPPKEYSPTIEYWDPKTFIKNHVAEGVIIDSSDIKYLPREICQQPDTKIWKIAHWGTLADYFLIEKLRNENYLLNDYISKNSFIYGSGLHPIETSDNISTIKGSHIASKQIESYYTPKEKTKPIEQDYRCINTKLFESPLITIKEGITEKNICASFYDYNVSYNKTIYGIKGDNQNLLKGLIIILNSKLSNYYLFLTSSSWGLERDRILLSEYLTLPIKQLDLKQLKKIDFKRTSFDSSNLNLYKKLHQFDVEKWFRKICVAYKLTKKQFYQINDTIKYSLDLFNNGENSEALRPLDLDKPITESYAKMLCNEINEFLVSGNFKVNARVYKVSSYTPLCMVVLQFVNPSKVKQPEIVNSDKEFRDNLNIINKYTLKKYSQNIYIRKQVRYYDDDTIFMIKPNQKRFWTRSQGIEDAHSLINDIALRKK